ncbi:13068_t:CDS:1, partial [Dentiscutata erythropus]
SIGNEQLYKLDNLIAELPINNPLSANKFLHLDDVLPIEEIPDDMVLIEQIYHKHDSNDTQSNDDDELPYKIFLQEGDRLAKSLVEFLLQQNDEFGVLVKKLRIVRH